MGTGNLDQFFVSTKDVFRILSIILDGAFSAENS